VPGEMTDPAAEAEAAEAAKQAESAAAPKE
jgi:hypothetical protein